MELKVRYLPYSDALDIFDPNKFGHAACTGMGGKVAVMTSAGGQVCGLQLSGLSGLLRSAGMVLLTQAEMDRIIAKQKETDRLIVAGEWTQTGWRFTCGHCALESEVFTSEQVAHAESASHEARCPKHPMRVLEADLAAKDKLIAGLAERTQKQSDLLSKKAGGDKQNAGGVWIYSFRVRPIDPGKVSHHLLLSGIYGSKKLACNDDEHFRQVKADIEQLGMVVDQVAKARPEFYTRVDLG